MAVKFHPASSATSQLCRSSRWRYRCKPRTDRSCFRNSVRPIERRSTDPRKPCREKSYCRRAPRFPLHRAACCSTSLNGKSSIMTAEAFDAAPEAPPPQATTEPGSEFRVMMKSLVKRTDVNRSCRTRRIRMISARRDAVRRTASATRQTQIRRSCLALARSPTFPQTRRRRWRRRTQFKRDEVGDVIEAIAIQVAALIGFGPRQAGQIRFTVGDEDQPIGGR